MAFHKTFKFLRNINRIDNTGHGWFVKFLRSGNWYTCWFGDSTYGGWEESMEEAIRWRDWMLEYLPSVTRDPYSDEINKKTPKKGKKKGLLKEGIKPRRDS